MKKFTLLLISVFTVILGSAQISITSDEVVGAGDVVVQAYDDNPDPAILPGNGGANVSWDFSALNESSSDTSYFMEPGATPFWSYFPDANLAMNVTDSGYMYMVKNSQKMAWLGMVVDMEINAAKDPMEEVTIDVVPEDVVAEFPVEYGNTMTDSYYMIFEIGSDQPGMDSVRYKITRVESEEIDAWGQLTLPIGTYNVLRSHSTGTSYDSVWFKSAIGWTFAFASSTDLETYNWWSDDPGTGFVIASLNMDESGAVSNVSYLKNEVIQSIKENNSRKLDIAIYPNPVENNLNIKFNEDFNGTVRLLDLTGQLIEEQNVEQSLIIFDLEDQSGGIYFYEIIGENGLTYSSGKIVKQ